jgi:hypothetical protein
LIINKLIRFSSQFSSKKAGKSKTPDNIMINPAINDNVHKNNRIVEFSKGYNKWIKISIRKKSEPKQTTPPTNIWIRCFLILPLALLTSLVWKVPNNTKYKAITINFIKEKINAFEGIKITKIIGIKARIIKTFTMFNFIIFENSSDVIKYKKVIKEKNMRI